LPTLSNKKQSQEEIAINAVGDISAQRIRHHGDVRRGLPGSASAVKRFHHSSLLLANRTQ
jgi:hypothetical protein